MRIHLLGVPHTITRDQFSHCAFTGKVQKMSPMMRPLGYEVVHYGVAGAESGADIQIDVLTERQQAKLLGHSHDDPSRFVGSDADAGSKLYREYNHKLKKILAQKVGPGELVLHAFGHATAGAMGHSGVDVESGIGYPTTFLPFRIFESYAWMHRDQGKRGREGNNYEWVIPNYFVKEDWPLVEKPKDYILFLGRIGDTKGLPTIVELAKQLPEEEFVICGQGDPGPYLSEPNIRYHPPVHGRERGDLVGHAKMVLMPSNFIEPFAGVAIEAMLCGTPVAAVTYGAFAETILQGQTGFRCRILREWIRAIELAGSLNRSFISAYAQSKYSLEAVGPQYDLAFQQIVGLSTGRDWYTFPSSF